MSKKNIEDIYPLSHLQQGILFHALYAPEAGVYVDQHRWLLRAHGGFDVPAFNRACQQLVDRHPVLRTGFVWERDAEPLQVVVRRAKLPFEHQDWQGLRTDEQQARFQSFLRSDRVRGFDLSKAPLIRVAVFQMADNVYQLVLTYHHIVLDAWSTSLLFRELLVSYEAFRQGRQVNLPSPRPYRDYIVWLRQRRDLSEARVFWQRELEGFNAPTPLVSRWTPHTVSDQEPSYSEQEIKLSAATTAALKLLAQSHRLTLNTLVQGAWALLLSRYSGEQDVVLGSVVSGRSADLVGIGSMVGLFINTLPLRVRVAGERPLLDWLKEIHAKQLELHQYEHVPLVDIHKWSGVPPKHALFDSMMAFENVPAAPSIQTDQHVEMLSSYYDTITNYPLSIMVQPGNELAIRIKSDSRYFDAPAVARMMGHFQTVLEDMATRPDCRLSDLTLLTQAERRQLLGEWNNTACDYPRSRCMHELLEAQVEQTPDAVAAVFEDQHITYRELDYRANQLAHYLLRQQAGPEQMVGICMTRSLEMLIAIYGILKAGWAYVPLDPAYPWERLALMLKDTQMPVLLIQQWVRPRLGVHKAQVICIDADWEVIARESKTRPDRKMFDENLAYVIYTSGSTGKPKGVMIPHRALVSHSVALAAILGRENLRVLQFVSLCFDASAEEIFPTLLNGGTLVLPGSPNEFAGDQLTQFCEQHSLSVLHVPTPFWHQWVDVLAIGRQPAWSSLRILIVGGDSPAMDKLEIWQRLLDHPVRFLNAYGPTEAAITTTIYEAMRDRECVLGSSRIPIGRPIANRQVYLLDEGLRPVPVGLPGEVYIGGEGLARGYLNSPELSAERFIPDPFSSVPGTRLYRTGDLGRYRADGNIEFLGRTDDQVKIRGFRIEPGEIEAILTGHPEVKEAIVVARDSERGSADKRLVAFVVLRAASALSTREIQDYLRERLPDYMVPSACVVLDALPLSSIGKVDRHALPMPGQAQSELEQAFAPPRTPVEKVLADIWAQVLGVERVGIHDNFFELGGDSILSLQVIARVNQVGIHFTPRQLFEHPTIAELATVAGLATTIPAEQGLVTGRVPLTPIQHWFFEQGLADAHYFNQALLLKVKLPLDPVVLERALRRLLLHHDALRLRYELTPTGWQQTYAGGDVAVPLTQTDLSALPEAEQEAAIERVIAELQAGLDLTAGPLVRAALFNLGEQQPNILFVVIHHLVVDGVSWRILLEDLFTVYGQLDRGQAARLPPKTASFKQWAERLTEYARSETLQKELDDWLHKPCAAVSGLPLDHPEGANSVGSARTVSVLLNHEETQVLLREAPPVYRTRINDVLLTALAQAISRWTGNSLVPVDLEGHGREELFEGMNLSRTVGWFTCTYPLLLDLRGASGPGHALKSVKEQVRQVPKRGIGYGILRYLCEDRRVVESLRDLPRPQVTFNYLGQVDAALPSILELAPQPAGMQRSPRGTRSHILEINASIAGGCLQVDWTLSENLHDRSTIEGLAHEFIAALRAIIAHCQSPEAGGLTPSDCPEAKLSQQQLDDLARRFGDATPHTHNIQAVYPLSPMQQGMLFHSLYDSSSGVYFEQSCLTLDTELSVSALERAWRQVVEQHAALRTFFVWEHADKPLQIVREKVELPWVEMDWRGLTGAEQRERLEGFLDADRKQGFDFAVAPLTRLALIRLAERTYQLVWSFHHMLMDGWCGPIILRQVLVLYKALCQGRDLQLEPPRPYRDYIAWLEQQDLTQAEAFWRKTLAGFTTPTLLGVDQRSRKQSDQAGGYGEQQAYLPKAATAALYSFARRYKLTPNTLVQGAWALLLGHYSGDQDLVFGTVVSGRPASLAGSDRMIGLFTNILPVRVRLAPGKPLLTWLYEFQAQLIEMQQYEYASLVQVQEWGQAPRGTPLFENHIVFENFPVDASLRQLVELLKIRNLRIMERTHYPLSVVVQPGDELKVQMGYDRRRFDDAAIAQMLEHLKNLLQGMIADPDQRLEEIPFMTDAERQRLLEDWNATQHDYPHQACIFELFMAQVTRTPDAVAVIYEDEYLTYQSLNRRANQLAHYLQNLGVGPDVPVGMCMERSCAAIVGIMAIWKAGGAYVPLDPTYPAAHLHFILTDTQMPVVLTQQQQISRLPPASARVVCLDADWPAIARQPVSEPDTAMSPAHLSHIMYTSGSTGTPKGVLVEQRQLINRIAWAWGAYPYDVGEVACQRTTVNFSPWLGELLGPLLQGIPTVIISDEVVRDPSRLVRLLAEHQVTRIYLVPSLLRTILEADVDPGQLPNLKLWMVGGECVPIEIYHRFRERLPGAVLCNDYGTTETHGVLWYDTREQQEERDLVPVGRPIANVEVFLLDERLGPTPVGVPGEIHVSSIGLARGYLNHPDWTAERFVPNPFCREPGRRLYKTGDLARYLPDGRIEYLGRYDRQIKLRGMRVELGGIEAMLSQHPAVRQAVVVAREDASGDLRLVAYVVPRPGAGLAVGELREFLQERLPPHTTPSALQILDKLPLLPNGKVDRLALARPDQPRPNIAKMAQLLKQVESLSTGDAKAILDELRSSSHKRGEK